MILRGEEITDVKQLGEFRLREADERECAAGGFTPEGAVAQSIQLSARAFAVYDGETLLATWGYAPMDYTSGIGLVWMFTTPEIEKHKIALMRTSRSLVAWLLTQFVMLIATVDVRHESAVKWLRWLGFKTERRINYARGAFFEMVKVRKEPG